MSTPEPCERHFWRHFGLMVFGAGCVVASAFVPALAPVLGPTGAKILAGVGVASLIASDPKKLVKPKDAGEKGAVPAQEDVTPPERPMGGGGGKKAA
jgi:hypothetical protein